MAFNNPLIPGDPYSYDLKWLVAKIKEILQQLGTLDEAINEKIFEGFLEHSVVQFKTVPEMLAADITDGSIVLTLGYYEAGDLGGLFYLVKDFNPSQCALDYFLTLDNNRQIAIPVFMTDYVTPEMFGAYGDGVSDDTEAMQAALQNKHVLLTGQYNITSDFTPIKGAYIEGNIDILRKELEDTKLVMMEPEGTYLVWIDCSAYGDISKKLLREAHVRVSEGSFFGMGGENFIRLNVACPRSVLKEALRRIKAVL